MQVYSPDLNKDLDLLDEIQHRATQIIIIIITILVERYYNGI